MKRPSHPAEEVQFPVSEGSDSNTDASIEEVDQEPAKRSTKPEISRRKRPSRSRSVRSRNFEKPASAIRRSSRKRKATLNLNSYYVLSDLDGDEEDDL